MCLEVTLEGRHTKGSEQPNPLCFGVESLRRGDSSDHEHRRDRHGLLARRVRCY